MKILKAMAAMINQAIDTLPTYQVSFITICMPLLKIQLVVAGRVSSSRFQNVSQERTRMGIASAHYVQSTLRIPPSWYLGDAFGSQIY